MLPVLGRAERAFARAVADDLGLTLVDLYALGALLADGPTGVVDLGRRLGLSSPAATGLADRLEASGHAERTQHPGDRRRVVLAATDRARSQLLARLAAVGAEVETLAGTFDDAQLEAIHRFLAGVGEIYERHA